MFFVRYGTALFVLCWLNTAAAQEPPATVRLEYKCTQQDMDAGGLHCTGEEPCPVFLELTSPEPVGARVFLAGNIHTTSVTLYSILLASPDAGKSWSEPFDRVRGASLERIQFFDYGTGWISGQIVQPLPRDPFLLLTTDGGATWHRRPVFSESRSGAVERFRFDSRTNGTVWIDRSQSGEAVSYERYETVTGGESWTLREALKRAPSPDPAASERETGWRLRVDARTESYLLERSREGKWQLVAAFLIPVAQCGPA